MKLSVKLALKNLLGAGLRTWLNVAVLSFAFVVIIFYNGLLDGWNEQARHDAIDWQYGQGQLHHAGFDPYDPFTFRDSHGMVPATPDDALTPILLRQASIYPEGRMLSVVLKGINPSQKVLKLPTAQLGTSPADMPAIIGTRMAESAKLKTGDQVLVRWRDSNGTFDAAPVTIVAIFNTDVSDVDAGQLWIPIEKLRRMTGLAGQATLAVYKKKPVATTKSGWTYKTQDELLHSIDSVVELERVSGYIFMGLLLGIALLAVFDTQVLSIFRRQKEIGTFVALGMTRQQVVQLFTVEGGMYSVFALAFGAIYGIPLFAYFANEGIGLPQATQGMGLAMARRLFPAYGPLMVLGSTLLVVITATIVSYLPARRIANMDPVTALKGKLQ